jgi:hypothetical protein
MNETKEYRMADGTVIRGSVAKNRQVYIVKTDGLPFFKIGVAMNPASRLSALQTACPLDLSIVGVWQVTDDQASRLEKSLHRAFKRHSVRGEWFTMSPPDLKFALPRLSRLIESATADVPRLDNVAKDYLLQLHALNIEGYVIFHAVDPEKFPNRY